MVKYSNDSLADQDVKKLRHDRLLIKDKIKVRFKKHKQAQDLIKEYYRLTDKLYCLGFCVPAKLDYLTLGYWGMSIDDIDTPKSDILRAELQAQNNIKDSETKINLQPEQSYYIFNLSWTEMEEKDFNGILHTIQQYFKTMKLKEISSSDNINIYRKEHTVKYELECSKEICDIICKSAQFIIDEISPEVISQNIAIYGKKKEIN